MYYTWGGFGGNTIGGDLIPKALASAGRKGDIQPANLSEKEQHPFRNKSLLRGCYRGGICTYLDISRSLRGLQA
jgi:hypothetical protein